MATPVLSPRLHFNDEADGASFWKAMALMVAEAMALMVAEAVVAPKYMIKKVSLTFFESDE